MRRLSDITQLKLQQHRGSANQRHYDHGDWAAKSRGASEQDYQRQRNAEKSCTQDSFAFGE